MYIHTSRSVIKYIWILDIIYLFNYLAPVKVFPITISSNVVTMDLRIIIILRIYLPSVYTFQYQTGRCVIIQPVLRIIKLQSKSDVKTGRI